MGFLGHSLWPVHEDIILRRLRLSFCRLLTIRRSGSGEQAGGLSQRTSVILFLACVRDILRPAPCEQELHNLELPLPLVTKLPVPACYRLITQGGNVIMKHLMGIAQAGL